VAKLHHKARLLSILFIFTLAFLALIGRLIWLQVIEHNTLLKLAGNQHNINIKLQANRGNIYDRNFHPLSANLKTGSIYANPKEIEDSRSLIRSLKPYLGIEKKVLTEKLKSSSPFVWLKRKIDYAQAQKIMDLGLKGIGMLTESRRFYPNNQLASHMLGFVGIDNEGLEGLEMKFNSFLSGTPGYSYAFRDAKARRIFSKHSGLIPPSDGYNLVLTIDEVIQHIAEKELDRTFSDSEAAAATVIVMNPTSGDILALANRPAFDLNNFNISEPDSRRNRAVTDILEPGSVFKVITASAALEEEVVSLEREFFCEEGLYNVGGHILHDHHPYGKLTFRQVIELSSNIGTVKTAQLLGKEKLYSFIKLFGFGSKTNIELPGEVVGIIRPSERWSGISIAAIPIGQEVAVTPIQLVRALSVIANGGMLVKPRIVLSIQDSQGEVVKNFEPEKPKRIISSSTASFMTEILEGVVERGTGKRAQLSEYRACGKTGTAQKLEPDGRYSHSKYVASFMGFAPASDPRVAVLVCVDEPKGAYYGGSVAAPAFKRITEDVLRYMKVEPDKT